MHLLAQINSTTLESAGGIGLILILMVFVVLASVVFYLVFKSIQEKYPTRERESMNSKEARRLEAEIDDIRTNMTTTNGNEAGAEKYPEAQVQVNKPQNQSRAART